MPRAPLSLTGTLIATLAATCALLSGIASADVYKYRDEHGNVLYTDKPRTLPAERLDMHSQKTDLVAVQARQDAEMQRMQAQDEARRQSQTERSEERAAAQLSAADKADRCAKARQRYDTYINARKLYEELPDGERRYLTSQELDAARAAAKASMDTMCQ